MAHCYIKNLHSNKASEGRAFIVLFYNHSESPIYVDHMKKPLTALYRHPLVKHWEKTQKEPIKTVILGTVTDEKIGTSITKLKNRLIKSQAKLATTPFSESLKEKTTLYYRMTEEHQIRIINQWVKENKIKTPPKNYSKPYTRYTQEQLQKAINSIAETLDTEQLNHINRLIKHFDVKTQKTVIVYSKNLTIKSYTVEELKNLTNKTRWFFKPLFPLRKNYSNEYVLTKKAEKMLNNFLN